MNAAISDCVEIQHVPLTERFFQIAGGHEPAVAEGFLAPSPLEFEFGALGFVALAPSLKGRQFFGRVTNGHDLSISDSVVHAPKLAGIVLGDIKLNAAGPRVSGIRRRCGAMI